VAITDRARAAVIARYRRHAARYDASTHRTAHIRRRAIELLRLSPGQTVVDVGCGTGLSFGPIEDAIGSNGRLIGLDQSPEMLAGARRRVDAAGWGNVTLVETSAEDANIPNEIDAFLFHFAHDVLRSGEALDRLLARARAGAVVAVAGIKLFPWWTGPANVYVVLKARPYAASVRGLRRPWSLLEQRLAEFDVAPALFGMGYVGSGTCRR
jgi:demethylmenaquinone methyltransferase/2-methoxy-6-polyprenyl-1,4-benzoquinol methylase